MLHFSTPSLLLYKKSHKSVIITPEIIYNCVKDVDCFELWCIIKM